MIEDDLRGMYRTSLKLITAPYGFKYEFGRILAKLKLISTQKWNRIEPIFIISTGRTGTKFLKTLFNGFKEIRSIHEPHPDFLKLGIDFASNRLEKDEAVKFILRNRTPLYKNLRNDDVKTYVESNNRLFSLIKPLIEVFDQPKIIHIVRDGRDFVRSGMSRPYGGYYSKGDNYPRLNTKIFEDDEYYEKWDNMSQFEKICWLWQKKDGFILDDVKRYNNSITVKFEDIFDSEKDSPGIKNIASFLELNQKQLYKRFKSLQDKKINKTKKYKIPNWENWDVEKVRKFNKIASSHMKKYGYY